MFRHFVKVSSPAVYPVSLKEDFGGGLASDIGDERATGYVMKPVLLRTVPSKASLARAANHFEAARRVEPKAVKGNFKPLKSGELNIKSTPEILSYLPKHFL